MNKSQSKYFHTAVRMDQAFLELLEKKDFEFITVTEICARAGVNRSTFYLHYETVNDLLNESVRYMNEQFSAYMCKGASVLPRIQDCPLSELHFVTPEYLEPYLRYIKEHKRLFRAAVRNAGPLGLEETYGRMFQLLFCPILERFQVPEPDWNYLMAFYIHGLMAIVTEWLEHNCSDSIDHLIRVIQRCVLPYIDQETSE